MISIVFSLNLYVTLNSNKPVETNLESSLQQTQQSLLSQCNFNSIVKIKDISAPLILQTSAILTTSTTRKKRQIDNQECQKNEMSFTKICNFTRELRKCDFAEVKPYLETYINQTVNY
jgi:hypothetical protein